jgi:hypothetical protein
MLKPNYVALRDLCLSLIAVTFVSFAPAGAQQNPATAQQKPTVTRTAPASAAVLKPVPSAKPTVVTHLEFLRDISPILDRSGCSTAQCHGKFGGRGGFQISLLTLSPEDDFDPIVTGARGRRINFAHPEESLFLLKATGSMSHGGGPRFAVNSPEYNTILRWIRQGAPFTAADPRLVSLAIQPKQIVLPKAGKPLPLKVVATYTDGSRRDVTRQTVFQSTDPGVIGVNDGGIVTGLRWGGGAVMGRYLGVIAATFVTLPQVRKGPYPIVAVTDVIDKAVFDNLKHLNVVPSALCTDTEFLRRVTLDTLGRLPTLDEMNAFAADTRYDKRARVIDALLERPEYVDFRTLRLSDLLRVNPRKLGNNNASERSAELYYEWIWNSVRTNQPWDHFVHDLLTARGSTCQVGPAAFYRVETQANDRMENIGQAFLGVRMSCARCHKHPFDRWNTDDYWNFSAFTNKVQLRGGKLYDENIVVYEPNAKLRNQSVNGKNRGKIAPPTFLGEKQPAPDSKDEILSLADWIVAPNNPFFARATMNRMWSYYFGRGIIQPVDDMRVTSPESVPGLLDVLAKALVESKYDIKQMTRLILNSRAYQISSIPNSSNKKDDRFFSHFAPRPMPAQVLLDIINQATAAREQFSNFPERSRAVQVSIPVSNTFLDAFGQSHREFLTDIDPKLEPNLVQTLTMINSPYIENKVRNGTTVDEVVKATTTDDDLIKACYLRTFSRLPKPNEVTKAQALLQQAKDRKEGAQDLLWALVTAREFYFNH